MKTLIKVVGRFIRDIVSAWGRWSVSRVKLEIDYRLQRGQFGPGGLPVSKARQKMFTAGLPSKMVSDTRGPTRIKTGFESTVSQSHTPSKESEHRYRVKGRVLKEIRQMEVYTCKLEFSLNVLT